jgi:CheY-like chemotaxis protein
LINDVLDLAKVESGKMEFVPERVDPNQLAAEVDDFLRPMASDRRIQLRVEVDPRLGDLILDPGKLKQVLFNYLSNALKFTPEGGTVTGRMRPQGAEDLVVEVEDTGIGIRSEHIPCLFGEFQQLDSTAAKKYQGTGLGLALTRRIVEAQGGSVWATSVPDQGSIFFARLPRVSGGAHRVSVNPDRSKPPSAAKASTVLVIEDDLHDRQWLTGVLAGAGYNVKAVATANAALRLLGRCAFDAIALDILLPDMSGWELLRQVRAGGPNRSVPVMVVSVMPEQRAGIGFAISDFLEKPVSKRRLLDALGRAGVHARHHPTTVLLVDDNKVDLKLFSSALKHGGFSTIARSNAMAALRVWPLNDARTWW